MQECNITCLPENYTLKYYNYHALSWPQLFFVAEDLSSNKIVGYVLSKVDDTDESSIEAQEKGHITSLAVHRDYRRLGIASKLMENVHQAMKDIYELSSVTLHVRVSNRAGLNLYKNKLSYSVISTDKEYYADNEDAFFMKKNL